MTDHRQLRAARDAFRAERAEGSWTTSPALDDLVAALDAYLDPAGDARRFLVTADSATGEALVRALAHADEHVSITVEEAP